MFGGYSQTECGTVQVIQRIGSATHEGSMGKQKNYEWCMYLEMRRRYKLGRLYEVHFPQPETPGPSSSVPPQRSALQMWLATAESSEEESEDASEQEGPPAEPDPAKAVFENHVGRIDEEAMCRAILINLQLETIPTTSDLDRDSNKLWDLVNDYNRTFLEEHTRLFELKDFPKTTRLWVQELTWCFDEMASRNMLPRNLRTVNDKYIRPAASQAAAAFGDPGNLILDVVLHVLRLWRYVQETREGPVLRVAPSEYGTAGNKSAKGPVNLRGNIIEALICDLQAMSTLPEHRAKGKGAEKKGGWHGKGKGGW